MSALAVRNSDLASISSEKTITSLSLTPALRKPVRMAWMLTPDMVFTNAS
jgi:hypothetical protein